MNTELLTRAVERVLNMRTGKSVTVKITTCKNCTHKAHCIESDRGPCRDYEDSYGGNDQTKGATRKEASNAKGRGNRSTANAEVRRKTD